MSADYKFAETIKLHYRVDRREIGYIKFILEAYDGLATVKTLEPQTGLVEFQVAPGCEADVEMVLGDLNINIMMRKVDFTLEYS